MDIKKYLELLEVNEQNLQRELGKGLFSASLPVQVRSVDTEARMIRFVASDETTDRYSTIISVSGWDLKAFKMNPVFLAWHDYYNPSAVIGRVMSITKDTEKKQLLADVLFMERDMNPMADMIFQMYAHTPAFLNAVSVGFIPFKMEEVTDEENNSAEQKGIKRKARIRFTQQELLEISAVSVPANPSALVDKAIQNGVDPVMVMAAKSVLPNVGDADEIKSLTERMGNWMCKNGVCWPINEKTQQSIEARKLWPFAVPQSELQLVEKKSLPIEVNTVVPYVAGSPDPDSAWDGAGARRRAAMKCSSDGSGEKDKMDWTAYSKYFTRFDQADKENFGAYHLPHHDVKSGEFATIWRGVAAAMQRLLSPNTDTPENEKRGAYNHLAKHYAQFDKEPPEFKSYDPTEFKWDMKSGKPVKRDPKDVVAITGLWLRTAGTEGNQSIQALVEVGGKWRLCIEEYVGKIGGEISHICEPLGIESAPDDDVTADGYVRSGAVLNRKNKGALKQAQELIQGVLDSAEPEEEPEGNGIESVPGILLTAEPEWVKELTETLANISESLDNYGRDILAAIDEMNEERVLGSKGKSKEDQNDQDDEDDDETPEPGPDPEEKKISKLDELLSKLPVKRNTQKIADAKAEATKMIALGREILSKLNNVKA